MKNVITGVLDKDRAHYLRCKDKAEKSYDVLRHKQLHMSKYKTNEDLLYIISKPTAQLLFKGRFPKSGPTYRRQVVNPQH